MPFKKLLDGYKSFHADYFATGNPLYEALARDGQAPETLVVACCDSRTDPALITGSQPGEMFVVRNVAAIVPPYMSDSRHHGTSAAIEFAVRTLKVKHAVVMGHSLCGGVHALAEKDTLAGRYEFLTPWMNIGAEALRAVDDQLPGAAPAVRHRALEQAMVLVSLNNLMTFPWLAERVRDGDLQLHGWYFDLRDGKLLGYDAAGGRFEEM